MGQTAKRTLQELRRALKRSQVIMAKTLGFNKLPCHGSRTGATDASLASARLRYCRRFVRSRSYEQ
ncbi:MAG TPA: hypothetical protein VN039_14330 [Nitrospira sp.]|nr:hypothetical protein [Nitrospira sp.]